MSTATPLSNGALAVPNSFSDTESFYVDCAASANDSHSGRSPSQAWKTLSAVYNRRSLIGPGDNLYFKRNCVFPGQLRLSFSGNSTRKIFIGAYGAGTNRPEIQGTTFATKVVIIEGSYLNIDNLTVKAAPGSTCSQRLRDQYSTGFNLVGSARNVQIQNSKATGNAVCVEFGINTQYNRITKSEITKNNQQWEHINNLGKNEIFGPMGILLHGSHQEIDYNTIADNTLCGNDAIRGSTIELYNASFSHVHHNIAYKDRVFLETGTSSSYNSTDNTFAYNLFYTDAPPMDVAGVVYGARFIVTRGVGHSFGPVYRTRVFNNSVYIPVTGAKGVTCEKCGPDILIMKNNILFVNNEPLWSNTGFTESHNIFWSPNGSPRVTGIIMSSSSKIANPNFLNPSTDPSLARFGLGAGSPALNAGTNADANISRYLTDLWKNPTPAGAGRDLGPIERQ